MGNIDILGIKYKLIWNNLVALHNAPFRSSTQRVLEEIFLIGIPIKKNSSEKFVFFFKF